MILLALWSRRLPSTCDDLFGLVQAYRRTQRKRLVVDLLECVEGPELRLSLLLTRLLRDPDHRQDFLHDFFAKLCEKLLSYDIETSVRGFVLTMARHEALNELKRLQREQARTEPLDSLTEADQPQVGRPVRAEAQLDLDQFLREAQAQLTPDQWDAVQRVYLDGLSRAEAAAALAITPTVLRGRLARAIAKLRDHFGEQFWAYFGHD